MEIEQLLEKMEEMYFEAFPRSPLYIIGFPVLSAEEMIEQIGICLKENKPIEEYFDLEDDIEY